MTDEGRRGDPVDAIEMVQGMKDAAMGIRAFYDGLREQEFSETEALHLTAAYVTGLAQAGSS